MERAKRDFILKKGVLGVGLPVALLMSLTLSFQVPGQLFKLQGFDLRIFLFSVLIFGPIFAGAGCLWGMWMYKYSNKKT